MPEFLPQPDQHVRLPVQTPRRSDFKMSSTAHAPYRGAFKEITGGGNMLLFLNVTADLCLVEESYKTLETSCLVHIYVFFLIILYKRDMHRVKSIGPNTESCGTSIYEQTQGQHEQIEIC